MAPRVTRDSIHIQTLQDDVAKVPKRLTDLARRIDGLGNHNGRCSDEEVNAFVNEHVPMVVELMTGKQLVPEARRLMQQAIELQLRAIEADENAAIAAAIDSRATNAKGQRIGNGDGKISRAELTAFIKDREALVKAERDADRAAEFRMHIELAQRVLRRLAAGRPLRPSWKVP